METRTVNGEECFFGIDGSHRYRLEFESKNGSMGGIDYANSLDEVPDMLASFLCSEVRVETPKMYFERIGKEEMLRVCLQGN